jgi:transposase
LTEIIMLNSALRLPSMPLDTAHATREVFNLTNAYLIIGDQAERWLQDIGLTDQAAAPNQSPATRIRLAFITLFQFAEDLPDRLAVNALHTRMEWKYALHLPLNGPGFDYTLLREYRQRLARNPIDQLLLQHLIAQVTAIGLLPLTERQDISVTDVLVSVSNLGRIEDLFEALSAALVVLAARYPDWLRCSALPHWYEGYRQLPAQLPHDRTEQERFAQTLLKDAAHLLDTVEHETSLAQIPELRSLKQIHGEQLAAIAD